MELSLIVWVKCGAGNLVTNLAGLAGAVDQRSQRGETRSAAGSTRRGTKPLGRELRKPRLEPHAVPVLALQQLSPTAPLRGVEECTTSSPIDETTTI